MAPVLLPCVRGSTAASSLKATLNPRGSPGEKNGMVRYCTLVRLVLLPTPGPRLIAAAHAHAPLGDKPPGLVATWGILGACSLRRRRKVRVLVQNSGARWPPATPLDAT